MRGVDRMEQVLKIVRDLSCQTKKNEKLDLPLLAEGRGRDQVAVVCCLSVPAFLLCAPSGAEHFWGISFQENGAVS